MNNHQKDRRMRNILGSTALLLFVLTSCAPETPKAPETSRAAAAKPGGGDGLIVLTYANFEKEVLHNKQPVLVEIGSPG